VHPKQSVPTTIGMGKFESAVVPTRIIPVSEIANIPGIGGLSFDAVMRVVHTPVNLQWMSRPVHWLKRGRCAATVPLVDADWQRDQVELEDSVRKTLYRVVAAASAGDGSALDELGGPLPTTVSQSAKLIELLGDGAGPVAMFDLPAEMSGPWRAIAASADPAERAALTLHLWNPDFCDLVPAFATTLADRLVDVQVCYWREEGPALLYFVMDGAGDVTIWVGWDPRTSTGQTPVFWETVPGPARRFLTDVHPGFSMLDGESFGLAQPSYMSTFAQWTGWPQGIPDWNRDGVIDSTRQLWITYNGADSVYCTSPELSSGQVITYSEGDHAVMDFGPALDQLMLSALRLPS
jgi:hypothetical protein